jgi:glutamyl-tRNA synthetase
VDAIADFNVTELKKGDTIQFERKGYYILDNEQGVDGLREFIHIPDGKIESSKSKAAADGDDTLARKKKAAEEREKKKAEKAKKEEEKAKKKAEKAEKKAAAGAGTDAGAAAGIAAANAAAFPEAAEATVNASKMYTMRPIVSDVKVDAKTNMYSMRPIV